jgi:hypothetical protein
LCYFLQYFIYNYGFSSQKPQATNKPTEDLEETRAEFAITFWDKYAAFAGGGILNVDETAIMFDMVPVTGPKATDT